MSQPIAKIGIQTLLSEAINCSVLTTGLHHKSFRLKDLMYYLDLIKNFIHQDTFGRPMEVQYVQLQRFLKSYEELGWVSSKKDGRVVHYQLRASGVRGLLEVLVSETQLLEVPKALLIQQMLDSYGIFLKERLQHKFPLLIDEDEGFRKLLQNGVVVRGQIRLLDQLIAYEENRIKECVRLDKHCQAALGEGLSPESIAKNMPSEITYPLSHQKPISEVLQWIPGFLANYEIREGFRQRQQNFHIPCLEYFQMNRTFYLSLLEKNLV